jgi:hypothetical protein
MGVIVFDGLIRGNIYLDFNKFNFKMEKKKITKTHLSKYVISNITKMCSLTT